MESPPGTKEKFMPDHPQYLYRVSYGSDYGFGDRHGPTREFFNRDLAKQVYDDNKHGTGLVFYCAVVVLKADESGELRRVASVCANGDIRTCDSPDCCSCGQTGPPNVPEFPDV